MSLLTKAGGTTRPKHSSPINCHLAFSLQLVPERRKHKKILNLASDSRYIWSACLVKIGVAHWLTIASSFTILLYLPPPLLFPPTLIAQDCICPHSPLFRNLHWHHPLWKISIHWVRQRPSHNDVLNSVHHRAKFGQDCAELGTQGIVCNLLGPP